MSKRKDDPQAVRSRYKWPRSTRAIWLVWACIWLVNNISVSQGIALPMTTAPARVSSPNIILTDPHVSQRQVVRKRPSLRDLADGDKRHEQIASLLNARGSEQQRAAPASISGQRPTKVSKRVLRKYKRAEATETNSRKTKSVTKPSKTSASNSSKSTATKEKKSSESNKAKAEDRAGKLPVYQMLMAFTFVVIVGGIIAGHWHHKKITKINKQRERAAKKLRKQYEREREWAEIPNPEAEMEADQYVENLAYAPEGLFYETVDPLAAGEEENNPKEEERWTEDQRQPQHGHHRHHHHHHHHHRQDEDIQRPPPVRVASRSDGDSFYEQQFARVDPLRY